MTIPDPITLGHTITWDRDRHFHGASCWDCSCGVSGLGFPQAFNHVESVSLNQDAVLARLLDLADRECDTQEEAAYLDYDLITAVKRLVRREGEQ